MHLTYRVVKKETESSKLRAAAQMRIEQYFVAAQSETGDGLPADVRKNIRSVLTGSHKTFRYMLFTGLLVAVTDKRYHPRCLQMNADVQGRFDARSLCQKVVVPFEKKMLNGRLGASNEPYANKSARFAMIEKTNNVRKGKDEHALFALYDVLEFVRMSAEPVRVKAFSYAISVICKMPANKSSVTVLPSLESAAVDGDSFFDFFEAHTKGVSAVAVLGAFFRKFYSKDTKVKVHPATESGASSKEVGDIDLEFSDGRRYAVEVKDKTYSDVDVNHACDKALLAGVPKVVFALGSRAEKDYNVHRSALMDYWAEKGVELTFLNISDSLGVAMAISDAKRRYELAECIGKILDEMNAPNDVKELYANQFRKDE